MNAIRRFFWYLAIGLYFISPIDVVPDIIIGIGWLDDLAFVMYGLHQIRQLRGSAGTRNVEHDDSLVIDSDLPALEGAVPQGGGR